MDLEPLTVLVGANGSGKTSVLEAIDLAVRATAHTARGLPRRCELGLLHPRRGGETFDRLSDAGWRVHGRG